MSDLLEFFEQVRRANDIVDVIGSFIDVKKRGQNYWARCPFHGEKTPSFSISPGKQFYHCFGCGESGDVIKFVSKYESMTYMEAVAYLANRANLKMPETRRNADDAALAAKKKKRDLYYEILRTTAIYYWNVLYSKDGEQARNYLSSRGFSQDVWKKFGLGYSVYSDRLPRFLQSKGYSLEDCVQAGVLQKSESGVFRDHLADRLIVPIFDIRGRVIAFGGRVLKKEEERFGKYKNTFDTQLWIKRNNLFAINLAKKQKQQNDLPYLVVVEGYMDVISMYQSGFRYMVASMGTSFTVEQAKAASRLCDKVYTCFDGDTAGQKATIRGMDILAKEGLEVFVMSVPEGLDPDEYIKKYGAEAFEKLVDEALPLADFKLKVLETAFPFASGGANRNNLLAKYVQGAVKVLAELDEAAQDRYLEVVSVKTGYSVENLRRKLTSANTASEAPPEASAPSDISAEEAAQYFVVSGLLANVGLPYPEQKPSAGTRFLEKMWDYLFDCKANGKAPSYGAMYELCPESDNATFARVLANQFAEEDRQRDVVVYNDCLKLIAVSELKQRRNVLLDKLKSGAEDEGELMQKINELTEKIAKFYE